MAAYYYAAYFNTPLNQSARTLTAPQHPFGVPSNASNLPISLPKAQHQNSLVTTVTKGTVDEQANSIFFRLPMELRIQIYEELLCMNTINPKHLAEYDYRPYEAGMLHPAILSTCHKIHDEAVDLLYTPHIFCAHPSLLTSLPHLTTPAKPVLFPAVLSKIKRWHLSIRLDTDPRFTTAQATAAFSGAEFLDIRVWQSMYDGVDCSVLKLFMGVRGVKIARVGGSANKELARWLESRMMMEKEDDEDKCTCENQSGVVRCGDCSKKMDTDGSGKWLGPRSVWQFGNR